MPRCSRQQPDALRQLRGLLHVDRRERHRRRAYDQAQRPAPSLLGNGSPHEAGLLVVDRHTDHVHGARGHISRLWWRVCDKWVRIYHTSLNRPIDALDRGRQPERRGVYDRRSKSANSPTPSVCWATVVLVPTVNRLVLPPIARDISPCSHGVVNVDGLLHGAENAPAL